MQTLPLAIWGLRPAEGTSEQPLRAETGFSGILEQASPTDEAAAATILGEERLEAGSIGPTAHDQELDQAESSEAASDLMALVMSFSQPAPAQKEADQESGTARRSQGASGQSVAAPIQSPAALQTSVQAAPFPATAPVHPEASELAEPAAKVPGIATQGADEAPISPKPATVADSSSLLAKRTIRKQSVTPDIQASSIRHPEVASHLARRPRTGEAEVLPEIGSLSPSSLPAAESPAEPQTSRPSDKAVVANKHVLIAQDANTASVEPAPTSAKDTNDSESGEAAPVQAKAVVETSDPVSAQSSHSGRTASSLSQEVQVETAGEPVRPEAQEKTRESMARSEGKAASQEKRSTGSAASQQAEANIPATRGKVDLPSFVHQSDSVSRMLTDRWAAWVKQNFSGAGAPKAAAAPSTVLLTSPNPAFNVTIEEGQIHMNLPRPVTEVFLAPAPPAFGETALLIGATGEQLVEEEAVQNLIPASMPSTFSRIEPATSKVLRLAGPEEDLDEEESPELGFSNVPSDEAPLVEDRQGTFSVKTKPQILEPNKASIPASASKFESDETSSSGMVHQALNQESEPAKIGAAATLTGTKVQAPEFPVLESEQASEEPIQAEPIQEGAESSQTSQTIPSVQVRTSDRPLSAEKAEAAISQAKEALTAQTLQARGHQTTIRLNPDDLGSLTISVRQRGRKVEAEITASLETVRQVLEQQKQELVTAVESKGSQLSQLTIKSEAAAEASQNSMTNQQGQSRDGQTQREAHHEATRFSRLTASHDQNSTPMTASTHQGRARQSARFDLTA